MSDLKILRKENCICGTPYTLYLYTVQHTACFALLHTNYYNILLYVSYLPIYIYMYLQFVINNHPIILFSV